MATPGQLVKELAAVVGAPEATVAAHDRNLRTAGLRSVRGRGPAAPKATARDAASLLTAVLASGFVGGAQVAESALAVRRYGATRLFTNAFTSDGGLSALPVQELSSLPEAHSFLNALEALIASAQSGNLQNWMNVERERPNGEIGHAPIIEITLQSPNPIADFDVRPGGKTHWASARYALSPNASSAADFDEKWTKLRSELQLNEHRADMTQYRRVTARTVILLGNVLADIPKPENWDARRIS